MNKTHYDGVDLQHSRNMVIIREGNTLSLINTVRLEEQGLRALDALGEVKNVIRIGAFHGRDDAFYCEHYQAKLWAVKGMQHDNDRFSDVELMHNDSLPFSDASVFVFVTSIHPEGAIHMAREGGVLITCDSIKNWETADAFFSPETAKLYEQQGFFGRATVSEIWKEVCKVEASDFIKLSTLSFKHLLSAHGVPLLNTAHEHVVASIKREFET